MVRDHLRIGASSKAWLCDRPAREVRAGGQATDSQRSNGVLDFEWRILSGDGAASLARLHLCVAVERLSTIPSQRRACLQLCGRVGP